MTEKDESNVKILKNKYNDDQKVLVSKNSIFDLQTKFDVILYLHVLEHIEEDRLEIEEASKKLKNNGLLIIMVPAHQEIYGNLDRSVGHYRRYEKEEIPSKLKIFIWDKIFTPISAILDFILGYKFGKCILAIYKKI